MPAPFVTPKTAPDPIQRPRDALRTLRQADRARREAEAAAHKQHEQATSAADAAHQTARQNAENSHKQTLTAAQSQQQSAQRGADSALDGARNRAQQQMDSIAVALRDGRNKVKSVGLERLWPTGSATVGPVEVAESETELARRRQLSARISAQLESAFADYHLLQERNDRRRRRNNSTIVWGTILLIGSVIAGSISGNEAVIWIGIVVSVAILFFRWNRDKQRDRAREQATQRARESRKAALELNARMPPRLRVLADQFDMTFVEVPAGNFTMGKGSSDERPQHTVYLDAFWIGRTEVTNAQYARCVEAGGCRVPKNREWNDNFFADHPVTDVSWDDAVAYTRWLTEQSGVAVRLPMEAEWEKAARGTDGRLYPWGNEKPNERLLNFNRNVDRTTPVGGYPDGASPYGALDMAGNVSEWVADWHDEGYYSRSPQRNPTGPESGNYRVLRGGSFDFKRYSVRCAYRDRNIPVFRDGFIGFRLLSPGS